MAKESILIITGDVISPDSGRPLGARGGGMGARISERSVKEVRENMADFLKNLGEILSLGAEFGGDYAVDKVEVTAQITGEGKVGILGTGVNVGASTGIKIILQKKAEP